MSVLSRHNYVRENQHVILARHGFKLVAPMQSQTGERPAALFRKAIPTFAEGNRHDGLFLERLPFHTEQRTCLCRPVGTRLFFIGSAGQGKTLAHVNFGYTASGSAASDQINYVGGVEYAATPKVTVVGDILGWNLRDTVRLRSSNAAFSFQQGPAAPVEQTSVETVALSDGSLNTALGTAGVKLNPWGNLLVSAHVLFPLTSKSGLKSGVSPVIGFEYSF